MLRSSIQRIGSTFVLAMIALTMQASAFVLPAQKAVSLSVSDKEGAVVRTAVSLLQSDLQKVLSAETKQTDSQAQIIIGTWRGEGRQRLEMTNLDFSWLDSQAQAFMMQVTPDGSLVIAGSDSFGTAYGIMELTRLLGVSPWEWWADVDIESKAQFSLPKDFVTRQFPNVAFRGICIGDEDWGLMPWSAANYEPSSQGQVGPKTTQRIFELLLRLRANVYWPPSRPCTLPFDQMAGCRQLAAKYGIFIGKDASEPLSISNYTAPLMFVDDGFGYITRFPTVEESHLPQGCGVYYHLSYQGAPHDYLWLGTASPFLMFQQLSEAYYHDVQRLWVINVGDIKPLEYQISLFMDMAWNLERVRQLTVGTHLEEFFAENIGRDVARLSSVYMKEYYHLNFQCKPEHLALRDRLWGEKKIRHRLSRYDYLQRMVKWVADSVRRTHPNRYDAFFELVEYPIMAAAAQCEKYHCAQLARHGLTYLSRDNVDSTWMRSDLGHNRVQELTLRYNNLRGGKWQGIMSSNPRGLEVFQPVPHVRASAPIPEEEPSVATFYGASYDGSTFAGSTILAPVLGLGASIRAMPLPRDHSLTYKFKHNYLRQRFSVIEIHMLPTHPINGQQRFTVSLDGSQPLTYTYDVPVNSEEWTENVLRNYAVVIARPQVFKPTGDHSLVITALDDGVVIDEVIIRK